MMTEVVVPPEFMAIIRRREGDKRRAYQDTKGIWTAGVGRNLENPGLSRDEVIALLQVVDLPDSIIDLMLSNDTQSIAHQVAGVVGESVWEALAPARAWALVDMGFMGPARLALFVRMLAAVRAGDWNTAADQALASQWAKDVGAQRASEVATMLRTGEWPA